MTRKRQYMLLAREARRSAEGGRHKPTLRQSGSLDSSSPLLRMQRRVGNQAVQRLVLTTPGGPRVQRDSSIPAKEATKAAGTSPEDKEALAKSFAGQLKGEKPKTKYQAGKAVQKSLQASLKTKRGQKVLKQLFKGKAQTGTVVFSVAGSLALWLAKKTDVLTTPDIRVGKNISISAEVGGSLKKPKSVMFQLKVQW